jgi:TorA maturation chaperone TorD
LLLPERDAWIALAAFSTWSGYLDACSSIARDECAVLSDLLASGELDALRHPLDYEAVRSFAARHFTGGLPQSVVPVESLYRTNPSQVPAYGGPSARYMGDLASSMGLELPARFASTPDHLAVEAGMAALLYRSDANLADSFVSERFTWLARLQAGAGGARRR